MRSGYQRDTRSLGRLLLQYKADVAYDECIMDMYLTMVTLGEQLQNARAEYTRVVTDATTSTAFWSGFSLVLMNANARVIKLTEEYNRTVDTYDRIVGFNRR